MKKAFERLLAPDVLFRLLALGCAMAVVLLPGRDSMRDWAYGVIGMVLGNVSKRS